MPGYMTLTTVLQRTVTRMDSHLTGMHPVAEPGFQPWVFPLSHKKIQSIDLKYNSE